MLRTLIVSASALCLFVIFTPAALSRGVSGEKMIAAGGPYIQLGGEPGSRQPSETMKLAAGGPYIQPTGIAAALRIHSS